MIQEHGKIQGIISELVKNSVQAGAGRVDVSIEDLGTEVRIQVKDDGAGMSPDQVQSVLSRLNQPRRDELEEYYGELAGESMMGTGLTLVGMMTDRCEIQSTPHGGTTITVYRSKR